MSSQSASVGQTIAAVTTGLAGLHLGGPDIENIEKQWTRHRDALAGAARFLAEAAQVLTSVADEQEAASGR